MNAAEVIHRRGLQLHPEGSYYRELYRPGDLAGWRGIGCGRGMPWNCLPLVRNTLATF
jgi:predicted cupin superfamily sugar epimerase